jgi:hypothetical protein
MKKTILMMLFVCSAFLAMAQTSPVKFEEAKHDFGKVTLNKPASTSFEFTNTTSKPVIIEMAQASCGCTTPEYPKKPILPGKKAAIKVTYNAAAAGHFTKSVTVKFADVQQPVILSITGEVVKG